MQLGENLSEAVEILASGQKTLPFKGRVWVGMGLPYAGSTAVIGALPIT